jgi:hypothetical protein
LTQQVEQRSQNRACRQLRQPFGSRQVQARALSYELPLLCPPHDEYQNHREKHCHEESMRRERSRQRQRHHLRHNEHRLSQTDNGVNAKEEDEDGNGQLRAGPTRPDRWIREHTGDQELRQNQPTQHNGGSHPCGPNVGETLQQPGRSE